MHGCSGWRQYFAAIIVSLGSFNIGISIGWSNPAALELINTFDKSQVTWIISIFSLGAFVGAILSGISLRTLGRKLTLLFLSGTALVAWIGLRFSEISFPMMIILRFIIGFTGGGFSVSVPVYIGEVASPDQRGRLGSIVSNQMTMGSLISYTIGIFLHWNYICYIATVSQIVLFVVLICKLPESPVFLELRNKLERTEEVRNWLGHCDCEECRKSPLLSSTFHFASSNIPVFFLKDPKRILAKRKSGKDTTTCDGMAKNSAENKMKKKDSQVSIASLPYTKQEYKEKILLKLQWIMGKEAVIRYEEDPINSVCVLDEDDDTNIKEDLKSMALWRPISLLFSIMFIYEFSGVSVMTMTSTTIFKSMGNSLTISPNLATFLTVGLVQFINSFVAGAIVDKWGRRLLLLTGAVLMGISQILLGTFFALQEYGNEDETGGVVWMAFFGCFFFQFSFSLSFGPVTWIIFAEIFPTKYRGYASMVASSKWIFSFTTISIFPIAVEYVTKKGCFFMMAAVALAGAAFLAWKLPETKGLSESEIEHLFENNSKKDEDRQQSSSV